MRGTSNRRNYAPQLVQQEYGYTATWAGLVLSPGGIVIALMMPVVGTLSAKVQPRTLIAMARRLPRSQCTT